MKAALWIGLAALLLHLPLVTAGPMADDYVQRLALAQSSEPGGLSEWSEMGELGRMGPWSLFDFGTRADFEEQGHSLLPWFTGEGWRVRFLRPLASLEIALHKRLLGSSEVARHLVGLFALAAVLAAAWRLFRGLELSPRAACLGIAVLGFSDAAVLPIGWAANRSSAWCLLATLLAIDAAGRRAALLAIGLGCTATLFKESGLVAFPLVLLRLHGLGSADAAVHPRRWSWTAGIALLLGTYLAGYVAAGYGTSSAMYAAPWSHPLRFAGHLTVLLTAGIASLAGPFPVDLAGLDPAAGWPLTLAGAVACALLWRLLRKDLDHAAAPFLAATTLLALVPEAGAAPSDRLLWPATAGAAGLLGIALDRRLSRWRQAGRTERTATAGLLGSALCLSGLAVVGHGLLHRRIAITTRAMVQESPLGTGPRDVLLLQASNGFTAFQLPPMHAYLHGEGARFQSLQVGRVSLRMIRTGDNSAEFEADQSLLNGPFERLFRTPEGRLEAGTVRQAGRLRFEILEADGGPTRIGLRADRSLDAPDLLFALERDGRFVAVPPPRIGESLDLRAPPPALPFVP